MTLRPMLFNDEMVRAILSGRKTMTRRTIRHQPKWRLCYIPTGTGAGKWAYRPADPNPTADDLRMRWTPPCHSGDLIYVREAWAQSMSEDRPYIYRADCPEQEDRPADIRWRPSIHMPKKAARIWLRATTVKVERLQDISAADVLSEGVELERGAHYAANFANRWNELNGYGTWDNNPWVWVIGFELLDPLVAGEEGFFAGKTYYAPILRADK